ncbi:MAG: hypothetical protein R3C49_24530 [Planctomycetaceae bacterium]
MEDRLSLIRKAVAASSDTAWRLLRHSNLVRPDLTELTGATLVRRQLLLWVDSAGLTDLQPHTLSVFQTFAAESPVLRKAVWARSHDFRMIRQLAEDPSIPVPQEIPATISILDTRVDRDTYHKLLQEAYSLKFPIAWPWNNRPWTITTDTGTSGFEFFDAADPPSSVRWTLATEMGREGRALSDWFERMYTWLNQQTQPVE